MMSKELLNIFINRLLLVGSITGLFTSTMRIYENDTWQNVGGMAFFTIWVAICLTNISLERKYL